MDGDGLWSATETGTPTTEKSPTIDSVTPGDRSITVVWTAPTNSTLGTVTAYDLRYIRSDATDKADGNWTVVSAVWTSGPFAYTLNPTSNPLANGTSYDVQMRAAVGTVQHPWSGVRSATPRTTPGAPTINSVTGITRALRVGWSGPSGDGGATITSYDLRYIKTSADETVDANWTIQDGVWTSGELTATVTGLETGTEYDVQVRAVNSAGDGPWSATRAGTTALSDDATLSALTLSGVRLTPSGATSYTASVGYTVTRVTITATTSDQNASFVVLDGNGDTVTGRTRRVSGGFVGWGERYPGRGDRAGRDSGRDLHRCGDTHRAGPVAHLAGDRSVRPVRVDGHLHHPLWRWVDHCRNA